MPVRMLEVLACFERVRETAKPWSGEEAARGRRLRG